MNVKPIPKVKMQLNTIKKITTFKLQNQNCNKVKKLKQLSKENYMRIKEIQFYNRAPFENLILHFDDSKLFILSGINGAGKTTIISYIVDALYEFAKMGYIVEFENISNKYYRISTSRTVLDKSKPSIVYIRFDNKGKNIDYIDLLNSGTEVQYNDALQIVDPIRFSIIEENLKLGSTVKYFTVTEKKEVETLFSSNLLTYFPAYRYEKPSYLNDPYSTPISFKAKLEINGFLKNPIEVTSDLPQIANWIMDIVLDHEIYKGVATSTFIQLNKIFTDLLDSKFKTPVRLGIGPRHNNGTRIQIVKQSNEQQVYPSIFDMSSGEHALICLFCELIRQADNLANTFDKISGIVLVDEIDKHLHIKLQKETLPSLIKLFPNVQFVVTSHSPFLSLGLADEDKNFYKLFDLDNGGISCIPLFNNLFLEVYKMMVTENEQFAEKYRQVLYEVKSATTPLLITEGKTDWKHLISAIRALAINDLAIEIYEYDNNMGDTTLMNLLKQFEITFPNRKIIGMFDRDNDDICRQISISGTTYIEISKNIFAFSIPIVNDNIYGPYISIEQYYPKECLLKVTSEGRRLFIGEEFYESGNSKCGKYQTRCKSIQNKVKINGVIDEKVYSIQDDPELKKSIALSKDDFAQLIYDENEYAASFNFINFLNIFTVIREIMKV